MVSINPMTGNIITPDPMFETISKNPMVVPLACVTRKGGKENPGKSDEILPEKY